jgi:hypothetical protein
MRRPAKGSRSFVGDARCRRRRDGREFVKVEDPRARVERGSVATGRRDLEIDATKSQEIAPAREAPRFKRVPDPS